MNGFYYSMYRCGLGSFTDFAFRELHPGMSMDDNWHIRSLSDVLQYTWVNPDPEMARKLVFNLPPGYLKTHICSVSFPAWILGRDPRRSVLIVSETNDTALEIRERCVELMSSKRYKWLFRRARIKKVGREVEFEYGGRIRHTGIGYPLPRRRSDIVIIDNPQSLHSLGRIDPGAFAEIGGTLRDPETGMILLVTRRLGENDLSSYFRSQPGWACMEIPVMGLKEMMWPGIFHDSHTYRRGELLHRTHEDWSGVGNKIRELGGDAFSWQYMQGLYRPETKGQRLSHVDANGTPWMMIGSFDPTQVAFEDLGRLHAEYLSNSLSMT